MGALGFLHGVEILKAESGGTTVESVSTSIICCVGTASQGEVGKPTVITKRQDLFDIFGPPVDDKGIYSLHLGLMGVFAQTNAICLAIRAEGNPTNTAEESAFLGSDAVTAGMVPAIEQILGAESVTGYRPAILICPGYSAQASIAGALETVGASLRAVVVTDGINDPEAALTKDVPVLSERAYPAEPYVGADISWSMRGPTGPAFGEKTDVTMPSSGFLAGAIALSDNQRGWWHSPSNIPLKGIRRIAKPVRFSISDKNSTANKLNEKGIACIVNYQGFRLWGNRSSDAKTFLSVTRTMDVIEESIIRAHLWAVDRNITKGYFEEVSGRVNAYLRQLVTLGAILGGSCTRDPDLNSADSIRNGEVYFRLDITPSYPAEHIVFVRKISNAFLSEVLK